MDRERKETNEENLFWKFIFKQQQKKEDAIFHDNKIF